MAHCRENGKYKYVVLREKTYKVIDFSLSTFGHSIFERPQQELKVLPDI
jgi:hypothetical protein